MARHLLLCGALALCLLCVHASAEKISSFAASTELSKAVAEHNSTLEDSWATVLAATLLSSNNGDPKAAQDDLLRVAAQSAVTMEADSKVVPTGANFVQYIARSFAKSFQETGTTGADAPAGKTSNKPTLYELLTTPLPEVLQKDGSIVAFQQLLQDIANPTALADFDPEIFKAALTGVGVEATIVNFAPCLVSNAYTGVAINQNLFSISPSLLKFDPTGVNVGATLIGIEPSLIDIGPAGAIAGAGGISVGPSLIDISPGGRSDTFIP
ncbi:g5995 [Coccomyxa elongata]